MSLQQLWFLVWEDFNSPEFKQVKTDLNRVKYEGLSLPSILTQLSLPGHSEEYSFFIHSQSMRVAVQLLDTEAVHATWQVYCKKDPVITIVVRKASAPSPNSSRTPSHSIALRERRSASGDHTVPDIPVRSPPQNITSGVDPLTPEKVILVSDDRDAHAVAKEYLVGWIESQLQDRILLTDISIKVMHEDQTSQTVQLTRGVWERSLIRGPWKETFAPLYNQHVISTNDRHNKLSRLREADPNFTQSCINLVHDLRTFGSNKGSRQRLEGTGHEFCLGKPYFNENAVSTIMSLRTVRSTVEEELRALAHKRAGGEICTSHDLSPLFESVLGVSWDKESKKAVSTRREMT